MDEERTMPAILSKLRARGLNLAAERIEKLLKQVATLEEQR